MTDKTIAGELEETTGTHRCPRCGHRFEPDPLDFIRVGPEPRRLDGDGPQDRVIECPGCGKTIGEFDLEDV